MHFRILKRKVDMVQIPCTTCPTTLHTTIVPPLAHSAIVQTSALTLVSIPSVLPSAIQLPISTAITLICLASRGKDIMIDEVEDLP